MTAGLVTCMNEMTRPSTRPAISEPNSARVVMPTGVRQEHPGRRAEDAGDAEQGDGAHDDVVDGHRAGGGRGLGISVAGRRTEVRRLHLRPLLSRRLT